MPRKRKKKWTRIIADDGVTLFINVRLTEPLVRFESFGLELWIMT